MWLIALLFGGVITNVLQMESSVIGKSRLTRFEILLANHVHVSHSGL